MADSKFKIYTKTGDQGTSSLYNGQRKPKDDVYFQALGDVDELNSALGVAREQCALVADLDECCTQLATIQSRLFDVGSAVATPMMSSSDRKKERTKWDASSAAVLEEWIDAMDTQLPALTLFILPSGGIASASIHMGRSICRRAERAVVPLAREGQIDNEVAVYMNRLSDYLFTLARYVAKVNGKPETTYKKAT
eukprot:gene27097-2321_t